MRTPVLLLAIGLLPSLLRAQLPQDNEAWRARCGMLNSMAAQIDAGNAPAALVAATHDIPSIQFATFAFDRSRAAEHYVACTVFYMAAIAERAGNGGQGKTKTAHNILVVAQSEYALATKVKPTAIEHVKRGEEEAKQIKAKPLTADESGAILAAIETLPVKLQP